MRTSSLLVLFNVLFMSVLYSVVTTFTHAQTNTNPVEVSVVKPIATKNYQTLSLSGTIEASQNANLAPLESGLVDTLLVEVGDYVEKGQVLLTLDRKLASLVQQEANANLTAAEVNLSEAKRLFNEAESLSEKQLAAKTLKEERASNVARSEAVKKQLQATLELQEEIVNRHYLKAPFAGIIYERTVDIGEWVTPSSSVLGLVSQRNKRLTIEVPQEYFEVFNQLDSDISIRLDNAEKSNIIGRLQRVVGVSNRQTRSFTAHISLPDNNNMLIGMSAKAEITLPNTEQLALWLPASAIKMHPDGGASIFTVVNNRAKRVLIDIIEYRGESVLVSNAKAEQVYVTSGLASITDNTPLIVNKSQPSS